MKKTPLIHWIAALAVVLVSTQLARAQTTNTYTNSSATNVWTNTANWTGGAFPNAAGSVAIFTSAKTVLWTNTNITVGSILASNTSGNVVIGQNDLTNDVITLNSGSATQPTIFVTNGGTLFMYANVEGTNGFNKTGAGKFTFRFNGHDMNYSGNITVSAGTFGIDRDGSLGNTNNDLIFAGASTFLIEPGANSGTVTLGAGRNLTLNAATTINNGNAAVSTIINGIISGANNLTFGGTGTLTLNGPNTYTGSTTMNGGTLLLGSGASLSTNSFSFSSGTSFLLGLGGNTQSFSTLTPNVSPTAARTFTISNGVLNVTAPASFTTAAGNGTALNMSNLSGFTWNGASNARTFVVRPNTSSGVNSTNTVILAAAGNGTNLISADSISVGGASASSATNNLAQIILGKTNTLNTTSITIGGFDGSGLVNFNSGITTGSLVLRGTNGTSAMGTLALGVTSSGTRFGAGVLDLTGGSLDAVVTTISIGNNTTGVADDSRLIMPGGTVVANTLKIGTTTAGSSSPNMTNLFSQGGGSVTVTNLILGENTAGAGAPNFVATYSNTGGTLYAGSITNGAGAVGASTARTVALNGSSATLRHIAGSDLAINGSGTAATNRINLVVGASGGTIEADSGRSVTLGDNTRSSGTGVLSKAGAGTLIILGDNTHSGGTTLTAGTIEAGSATALGTGTIGLNGGTLLASGASRSYTNAVSVGGNVTLGGSGNGFTFSGPVNLGGSSRTLTISDNTTISGAITNGGLTKAGASTLTLSGANSYSGGTVVSAGALVGSGSGLTGAITNNSAVILSGSGTYSGAMSGSGSLTKESAGNYTLSGNSDFSGATTVSAGRLIVNGTNANSAVTVSSGASLGGNGEVGTLTVGGMLAPGNSIGTLSAGNTTFLGNGAFELEIYDWNGTGGTGWDLFDITGDLTLSNTSGSPFTINLVSLSDSTTPGLSTGWNANLNYTNTFITYSGGLLGETFNTNLFAFNLSGFQNATNGSFSIVQVTGGLALLYETAFVPATSYVWNAGSGDWSSGANWDGSNAPTNGAVLVFTGGGGFSTNNSQMTDVQGLSFSNTTGSITLDGSGFAIGAAGIENDSTNAHTINNNLSLAASSEFNAVSNGLTFAGNVTNDYALTVSGAENTDISGLISGTGSLIKSSAGTLTLSGANAYSGGSTVSGGAVFAASDSALGSGNVTLNGGTTLAASGAARSYTNTVTFGGDVTLGGLGNGLTLSGAVNLGGLVRTLTAADNATFSGTITNGGITKAGSGTIVLSGANSYSGGTTLSAGAIEAANESAIGSGTLALDGGTFAASGAARSYNNSITVGGNVVLGGLGNALTLSGGVNLGGAMRTLTTADNATLSGIVSNGGLTKDGVGSLTLLGANTYTGGTMVNAGVLSGSTTSLQGSITNNASVEFSQTTNGTYAGAMSGGGSLTKSGSGTVTLSGANGYIGGTLVSAGGLVGSTTSLQGAITNNGALEFSQSANGTYVSVVSGTGSFTKSGTGTITLNGANTYTGTTTLSGGGITLGTGAAISTNTVIFTGSTGLVLNLGGNSQSVGLLNNNLSSSATTLTITNGNFTIAGAADQTLGATINGSGTDLSGLNNFIFNGTTRTFQMNATGANVTNTVQLSKLGTNTISAANVRWGGGGANAAGQNTLVKLGQGNVIEAGTELLIGFFQGSGNVSFADGVTNGALTIRGAGGGANASPLIRIAQANSGNQSTVGILNLSGGSIDALATDFDIAVHAANTAGGAVGGTAATGTLTMPAGTIVAGTMSLGRKTATTGSPAITSTVNQSGGTVTATNLYLGNSGSTDATNAPGITANYNLTGGTLLAQTISGNGTNYSASTVRNLNLNGGTVRNISGSDLAITGLADTSSGRLNVALGAAGGTFNADAGRSITIGANARISNSGQLTKAGDGTLVLASSNTYAGGTRVNAGTIYANHGNGLGTGIVTVTNGTVFAGAGQSIANNFVLGDSGVVVTGGVTNAFTAYYNFGTVSPGDANTTTTTGSNIAFGAVSQGNNNGSTTLLTTTSGSTGYSGASGSYNAGAAAYTGTLSNGSTYFEFSLTADSGYNLSLTNLTFGSRSTSTGPQLATLLSSIDSYTTALATNAMLNNSTWALIAPNVTASTQTNGTVTFRIYGSAGTGTATAGSANWRIDDLNLYGVTVSNTYATNAASGSGTVGIQEAGSATYSGNFTVYNTGTLTAAAGGQSSFTGVFTGGASTSLSKSGSGTVTLSGNNSYAGSLSVDNGVLELATSGGSAAGSVASVSVASGATLLLSQSAQVNNNATVSLSGGTISRASGVSETFGALTVSSSSTLDFGSGTEGNMTFGTYTPSSLLTVANFFGGNTLVFGSDLTSSIAVGTYNTTSYLSGDGLFQINSISGGFTTSYSGGSFTITAIPEPSTYLAAAGLLGLMLWPSRRRILKDAKAVFGLRAPMRDRLARR